MSPPHLFTLSSCHLVKRSRMGRWPLQRIVRWMTSSMRSRTTARSSCLRLAAPAAARSARLIAHGFTYAGDDIGMAADLSTLPAKLETPPGLVVERVRDGQDLIYWTRTLAAGFGEGEREAAWVGEMYRRIGLGDQ